MSQELRHSADEKATFFGGLRHLMWLMPGLPFGLGIGTEDLDDMPRRVSPLVLLLWTLVGVLVGGVFALLRLAFGADPDSPRVLAVAAPMFLPTFLATAQLPRRRGPALAAAVVAGAATGAVVGLPLASVTSLSWALFAGSAGAALAAAGTYGAVARADDPADPKV